MTYLKCEKILLVDGGYGEWGQYSDCSKSCGGGTKTRARRCDNPVPAFGGKDCESLGATKESAQCNTHECPGKNFFMII